MNGISRKSTSRLLILAVPLGSVLPHLFALFGNGGALNTLLPRFAASAVLIFLAQSAPFGVNLADGGFVTVSM